MRLAVPQLFAAAVLADERLLPVKAEGKCGSSDHSGRVVIEQQIDQAGRFTVGGGGKAD
jgi:hypothetical protein